MAKKKSSRKKRKQAGPGPGAGSRHKPAGAAKVAKLFDRAIRLHQAGSLQQADRVYRQILAGDPRNVPVLWRRGILCHQAGLVDEAIRCIEKAVSIRPDFADGHNSLGILRQEKGDLDGAIFSFTEALAINPAMAEAHNNLGNAYLDREEFNQAEACFQKAVSLKPGFAEACFNLAKVFKRQGCIDKAKENYRKALSIRPDYAEAHRYLSRLRQYREGDAHVREMENLLTRPGVTDYQRMHLSFALGKAYGDMGKYEKSFTCLMDGNRLKRKYIHYSTAESKSFFKTIKSIFNYALIAQFAEHGIPDGTPLFILGMPRSGTSLVEQILASHPDVHGAGELDDFRQAALRISRAESLEEAFVRLKENNGTMVNLVGTDYLQALQQFSIGTRFITDKMPHNFLLVGLICLALPQAKIIHCVRDPADNCFSIFRNYFSHEHNYGYDLVELGEYYLLYQDLMRHWHDLFPGRIYDISYEKLVSSQEEESRKLVHHCGLDWSESCLSFYTTPRAVSTISAAEVRRPIYSDSVRLWKRYEKQLQPLTEVFYRGREKQR